MKDRDLPLPPRPPSRIPPRPRPRSYEEDMTPPRGMRDYRPEMTPGGIDSYEEDMTPPAGMRNMKPRVGSRMKAGGKVKKMASGGSVKSSCQRGDGAAIKGKTKGKMV